MVSVRARLAVCMPLPHPEVILEESSMGQPAPGPMRCQDGSRVGALLIWELGEGIRVHCYCLFDEGLNLVNPDLLMGFLI